MIIFTINELFMMHVTNFSILILFILFSRIFIAYNYALYVQYMNRKYGCIFKYPEIQF